MASDETPSRYPYLISVRGGRPRPARRDGSYYVCAYPTHLGLWWAPRDVKVLDYDPHRDFYQELRAAYLAAHPEAILDPPTPTPAASNPTSTPAGPASGGPSGSGSRGSAGGLDRAPTLFERVDARPAVHPAPPESAAGSSSRPPGRGR